MVEATKIGVIGAYGRMGSEVCRAVEAADGLELAARVGRADSLELLSRSQVRVAVEFTTPRSALDNILFCVERGMHVVVGTTGLAPEGLERLQGATKESGARVFVAPNFAIGAVLMMRFAALAAPYFERAEIIERHHAAKLDAPSGTALRTAALMNEARLRDWGALAESTETVPGSRGGDVSGIRVHSLRMEGSVAHQEVVLGGPGQTLTIRHDSLDRSSFMPGVVLAIKRVAQLDGVTVGLEHLLDDN